jgi:hypothetical protein
MTKKVHVKIQKNIKKEEKVPETQICSQSGDVSINLPRNDTNIEIIKSILNGLKNNK